MQTKRTFGRVGFAATPDCGAGATHARDATNGWRTTRRITRLSLVPVESSYCRPPAPARDARKPLPNPPLRPHASTLRRSALAVGFLALLAQNLPAFQAAPRATFRSQELLLDRIATAHVSSPLLDAAPLGRLDLDLDALATEARSADGARRQWRLPFAVRRDEEAAAHPPEIFDAA